MGGLKVLKWLASVTAVCVVVYFSVATNASPEPTKFSVSGPGLESDAATPARYFYVTMTDTNGDRITVSIGKAPFDVEFTTPEGSRARVMRQVLDRNDGSYVVRYKLFESYPQGLIMSIRYRRQHVSSSPYTLSGIYHEECYCPISSTKEYAEALQCPVSFPQIDLDFKQFNDINLADLEVLMNEFNRPESYSVCHYSIVDNKIYRRCNGKHVGFKQFMDDVLLSLARKVRLPDIEFISNLGDWPLVLRRKFRRPLPMVSWCGSDDSFDIILPTYDLMLSVLGTMSRVSLEMLSIQANTGPRWQDKNSTAFWRGRDSRQERLDLVKMSRKHPEELDAALTHMFFFPKDDELYGPLQSRVSFFDFFKYKYQITVDGTVAAYRFPYLLAGDSLVLKQDSGYYEHFYNELKPWVHYVPLKADLSDTLKQLEWARQHDEQAQKIALRGQEFARENLQAHNVYCYHIRFFERYASLMKSSARVHEGQELVEQPGDRCDCQRAAHESSEKTEL